MNECCKKYQKEFKANIYIQTIECKECGRVLKQESFEVVG